MNVLFILFASLSLLIDITTGTREDKYVQSGRVIYSFPQTIIFTSSHLNVYLVKKDKIFNENTKMFECLEILGKIGKK